MAAGISASALWTNGRSREVCLAWVASADFRREHDRSLSQPRLDAQFSASEA